MLVVGGSTNVTTYFAMRLAADDTAATGLTITGFDLQYVRSGAAPVAKVDATALVATDSAHGDNQAIEIDATDQPGLYRVDWPDAAFAGGVREVVLSVKVATAFTEHLRVTIDGKVTAEALGTQAKVDVNAYAGSRGPGVYLNDTAANTNTTNGVDGTAGNPVSTIAAAKTLADSMSLDRIYLVNDTVITLTATMQDYEFVGVGEFTSNVITLGSQDVDHSHFVNCVLTGIQGGALRLQATNCDLFGISGLECTAIRCAIAGTLTVRQDCFFDSCWSASAGLSTPILDINSIANVNVNWRHYSGGMQVANAVATTVISYEADGQLIIAATCTGLTVAVRGNCSITDNGTASSITQDAAVNHTNINAEVDIAINDAKILTTQMTEAYAANGVAPTMAQAVFSIHQMLMQFGIAGTSLTVRKLDNTTPAFVVTLDDATLPTDAKRV